MQIVRQIIVTVVAILRQSQQRDQHYNFAATMRRTAGVLVYNRPFETTCEKNLGKTLPRKKRQAKLQQESQQQESQQQTITETLTESKEEPYNTTTLSQRSTSSYFTSTTILAPIHSVLSTSEPEPTPTITTLQQLVNVMNPLSLFDSIGIAIIMFLSSFFFGLTFVTY